MVVGTPGATSTVMERTAGDVSHLVLCGGSCGTLMVNTIYVQEGDTRNTGSVSSMWISKKYTKKKEVKTKTLEINNLYKIVGFRHKNEEEEGYVVKIYRVKKLYEKIYGKDYGWDSHVERMVEKNLVARIK